MARSAEKNDVDIGQLFKWSKEVELSDPYTQQSLTVYMRLVGDQDLNRARAYALRKSAEMRVALREENSDERIAFINELGEFKDKESLVAMLILLSMPEIQREAVEDVVVPEPKEPKSDASLEDQEEYQKEVDAYAKRYEKALEKTIKKIQKRDTKIYEKEEMDELYSIYETLLINRLCTDEMNDAFYDKCIYYSTYKDKEFKNLAFKSFEDFLNASYEIKNLLKTEYQSLELGIDTLKKSQEATQ